MYNLSDAASFGVTCVTRQMMFKVNNMFCVGNHPPGVLFALHVCLSIFYRSLVVTAQSCIPQVSTFASSSP